MASRIAKPPPQPRLSSDQTPMETCEEINKYIYRVYDWVADTYWMLRELETAKPNTSAILKDIDAKV